MPKTLQDGLRAANLAILEPLCIWLHAEIRRRRTENDDADLAQDLCEELRRMKASRAGRRRLREAGSMPAFMETVARRLRHADEVSKERYEDAVKRFVADRRVPDPAEHINAQELIDVILRETLRLDELTRRILSLHFQGLARREIARRIWSKRSLTVGDKRVKEILQRARATLRFSVLRAQDGPKPRQVAQIVAT